MPDLSEVLKSALSLKLDDRAALVERLLASLDDLGEEGAERVWAQGGWMSTTRAGQELSRLARSRRKRKPSIWITWAPDIPQAYSRSPQLTETRLGKELLLGKGERWLRSANRE
jgi:hypothetical protein